MNLKFSSIKVTGFTLIELMVAVAILGILASVALPSYQNYVRQSNRAIAKSLLYENAQFMERFYTQNNQYDATVGADGVANRGGDDIAVALPLTQSPRNGTVQYNISLQAVTDNTFILQAIPTGTMAGDLCGTLTLTHTGVQGADGNIADCWNR